MTGTQSLSAQQLATIQREIERANGGIFPAGPHHFDDNVHVRPDSVRDDQIGFEPGHVVTVDIHQSHRHADGRKRVGLHRAYADTVWFGVLRNGRIIPSGQAA